MVMLAARCWVTDSVFASGELEMEWEVMTVGF
jgi:hypothetical protein